MENITLGNIIGILTFAVTFIGAIEFLAMRMRKFIKSTVKDEIDTIRDSIDGRVLKVIIETCLLTEDEIIKMTEICNETFVNFIKTSTGFDKEGAKLDDVNLIMKHKNEVLEVKASGGIRNSKDAEAFIKAGATRLGTSHGIDIIKGDE